MIACDVEEIVNNSFKLWAVDCVPKQGRQLEPDLNGEPASSGKRKCAAEFLRRPLRSGIAP